MARQADLPLPEKLRFKRMSQLRIFIAKQESIIVARQRRIVEAKQKLEYLLATQA